MDDATKHVYIRIRLAKAQDDLMTARDDKANRIVKIKRMRARDIAAGMRLKAAAGWNQTEDDWRLFLTLSPDGCFVAVHSGKTVGTVTTLNYENRVSWISMLLVDPAFRQIGIGTRLMQRAIESLAGCQTIKLDATLAGKKLYNRLGFREEYRLNRMAIGCRPSLPDSPLPGTSGNSVSPGVCPITDEAFVQVAKLDRRVFDADRTPILRALRERSPGTAWQRIRHGRVRGFCLGRRGAHFHQIGPLIAETCDDAITLCKTAMFGLPRQAVVLDVPELQEEFLEWLCGLGFAAQRAFARMYRGNNSAPGILEQQFAISGPELG